MTKKCTICLELKPLEEYSNHKNGKFGKHSRCKFCQRMVCRISADKHRKNKPDNKKNSRLKYDHGITLQQYNQLKEDQNDLCAICKNPEIVYLRGKTKALYIDHCHETGKIRGLLCHACNSGIGYLKDSEQNLLNAIEYLRKSGSLK